MSSSSATMMTVATSPKPRLSSKANYSSPATLETDAGSGGWFNKHLFKKIKCECTSPPINHQTNCNKFAGIPKCSSALDMDQRESPRDTPQPRPPANLESSDEGQDCATTRFSEFLKQRLPPNGLEALSNFNLTTSDQMQVGHQR